MPNRENLMSSFVDFLRHRFSLVEDSAPVHEVSDRIDKGVHFSGTNLWTLMFATIIACVGLNINNSVYILGSMLISPLMGPIIGIGFALGVSDFELLKRSLRNFALMVMVCVLSATIYFLLTPITKEQSELLARTTPTIYDVLIAFFGGLAGITANTRKDQTASVVNVISGVAIATALLPPLCTIGYGLVTLQFKYVYGALYLFFINIFFIAIASYLIVRILGYSKKQIMDKSRERMVNIYMFVIALLTIIPSVIMGYRIVQRTIFETNVERYVSTAFDFNETLILNYEMEYHSRNQNSTIDVLLVGEPLSAETIAGLRAQLPHYGLGDAELVIRQSGGVSREASGLNKSLIQLLDERTAQVEALKEEIERMRPSDVDSREITKEASVLFVNIQSLLLSRSVLHSTDGSAGETVVLCIVTPRDASRPVDEERLRKWLEVRTETEKVKIYIENNGGL